MSEGEEGLLEERGRVYDLYRWHLALYVLVRIIDRTRDEKFGKGHTIKTFRESLSKHGNIATSEAER